MARLSVALSFRPYGISFLQQKFYLDAELKDVWVFWTGSGCKENPRFVPHKKKNQKLYYGIS